MLSTDGELTVCRCRVEDVVVSVLDGRLLKVEICDGSVPPRRLHVAELPPGVAHRLLCHVTGSGSAYVHERPRDAGLALEFPAGGRSVAVGLPNSPIHTVRHADKTRPSCLDYANSILFTTSTSNVKKLQRDQNALARIVLANLRSTPVASLILRLHWLPVALRIRYKLATTCITYKPLSVAQPTYLHLLLQQHQPTRSLRSGSQNLLALPTLSSEFGRHAFSFSYCAPSVWDKLPLSIRSLNSFNSFKPHLKTNLVNQT